MSNPTQLNADMSAFLDRLDTATTALEADWKAVQDFITTLQNSPGTFSPADQTTMDALEARVSQAVTRQEALANLEAPKIPPAPAAKS